MRVGLCGEIAIGVRSPALGYVTGIAVDFFAKCLSANDQAWWVDGDLQLTTTLASLEVRW